MSADRCKQCRLKAESHYESAYQAFVSLSDSSSLESLRVQLERVALCEHQLASKTVRSCCWAFSILTHMHNQFMGFIHLWGLRLYSKGLERKLWWLLELYFYRPDALPDTLPIVSMHWRTLFVCSVHLLNLLLILDDWNCTLLSLA